MPNLDSYYRSKRVLVTGHTGFKGSWLTIWLLELGAQVAGFSLPEPVTTPNLYTLCGLADQVESYAGSVADYATLKEAVDLFQPEIIFHMAAQPLVLPSYQAPQQTFEDNVMGTVNLLEAVRHAEHVRAVVCITTDKVYTNQEWLWGYRENDRLGGKDPYSASKAMCELAVSSYRESFFPPEKYAEHRVGIATARAGNVIGGGDFAPFRLVPDCLQALSDGDPILLRNPNYIRPWQHVLVPLSGYLLLAQKLATEGEPFAEAWNFGPLETYAITTADIAEKLIDLWGSGSWVTDGPSEGTVIKRETGRLRLSWEKAEARLSWRPAFSWTDALEEIVAWQQIYLAKGDLLAHCRGTVQAYSERFESVG